MKLEVNDIKMFTNLLDALSPIISEDVFIKINPEKLEIVQIDPARVSLVLLEITPAFFDGYQVIEENIFPIDYETLMTQIGMFKQFDRIKLEYEKENSRIKMYASKGRKRKTTYLPLLVTEYEAELKPNVLFSTILILDAGEFDKALKDCKDVGDNVVIFENTLTDFIISTKSITGENIDSWKIGEDVTSLFQKASKSAYPTETLKDMTGKAKLLSEKVIISFGKNIPCKLTYDFKGGNLLYFTVPILDPTYVDFEEMENA